MISKFLGKEAAEKIRNKTERIQVGVKANYNQFEAGRQRIQAMRNRFPGWDMRGSYKTSGMDAWHLENAVKSARRDGYAVKLVPSKNARGEKVKVLFIKFIGREEPVKKKRAPAGAKDIVPKSIMLKGKKFKLAGMGSLDYAMDRKKGFQYDGYLATTRKLKDPYGVPFWAVYAYRC